MNKIILSVTCLSLIIMGGEAQIASVTDIKGNTSDSTLVAYYPFNGNTNDESGFGNNGTNNGAALTSDRFGNDSSAYEFDGNSSYISIPSSPSLKSPVEGLTLSAWVYTYNFSLIGASFGPILMKSNSTTNAFQYRMAITTSGVTMSLNDWNTGQNSNTPVSFNEWHHIVATFKEDSARFYQDGVLVDTDYFPVTINADDRVLEIGRDVPGATEIFYGKIDDIRIYNKAIPQETIDSLYGENGWSERDPTEPELIAYYPFDGNADDHTPNNNHGTVIGATLTSDRFGNDSSAYHFDGISSYIDIGSHPILKMDDAVTIATWINIDFPLEGGTGFYNVLSDHSSSHNNGKIFRFQGNGIEFLLGPEGSLEAKYTFADSIAGWQHIATTYDGDSIKIYVNGKKVAAALRAGAITVNPNSLLIGKSGFGEFFTGDMDDLRIYKGALSASQIAALADSVITSINDSGRRLPTNITLYQNYPNPFNPTTNIRYQLATNNNVSLKIYDITGKEIITLINQHQTAGYHSVVFDASGLASGIYFYQLKAGSFIQQKKLLLLR